MAHDGRDRAEAGETPVIGLTGGIAAGKSSVAEAPGSMGCAVKRSDEDVRALLGEPDIISEVAGWWGDRVLDASGGLDRRALAAIVFSDEEARKRLEGLLHPRVEQRRRAAWEAEAARRVVPAFVIDAPLLFEAGLDARCDAVLFVDAPLDLRDRRARRDRGWAPGELERRENSQWPLEVKRQRSDHVIVNDADPETLRSRVAALFVLLLTSFADGSSCPGDAAGDPI